MPRLGPPHSQEEQQGKAGQVKVALGPEELHVEVLEGAGAALQGHPLWYVVPMGLLEGVCREGASAKGGGLGQLSSNPLGGWFQHPPKSRRMRMMRRTTKMVLP